MAAGNKKDIDEILLEAGILSIQQLKKVWEVKRETKKDLEEILIEQGLVKKTDLLQAHAIKMDVEFVDLSKREFHDLTPCNMISEEIANKHIMIPIEKNENILLVAMKDPTDIYAIDDLRISTAHEVRPLLADPEEIKKLIDKVFAEKKKIEEEKRLAEEKKRLEEEHRRKEEEERLKEEEKKKSKRLGDHLIKAGVITEEQVQQAIEIQQKSGGLLGEILVSQGFLEKKTLLEFLEVQLGIPHVDLDSIEIPDEVAKLVSDKICRRYTLIPFEKDGIALKVAMVDPMNIFSLDDLRLVTGLEIQPYIADSLQINQWVDKLFGKVEEVKKSKDKIKLKEKELDEEIKKVNEEIAVEIKELEVEDEVIDISDVQNAPIVKMVNIIFNKAIASGASDIHIEPQEDGLLVRFRIDGQLVESMRHDKKIHAALVARIKIISGLNIAEKRIPQDGRISMKIEGNAYDLRVSILPTIFGEKIVIRIQDKEGFNVSKKELGFFDDDLEKFDEILSHPHGIVLVTGPTGSGKSTTLYTALKELCKEYLDLSLIPKKD